MDSVATQRRIDIHETLPISETPSESSGRSRSSVLVVNLYYPPDTASTGNLLHELCAGLVWDGNNVHVLTGQPSYSESIGAAPEFEVLDGVNVHRVPLSRSAGKSNLFKRAISYGLFMFKAWKGATEIARRERVDSVITVSNPPAVGLIGRRVSRKLNIPFHYTLFDIHPDAIQMSGAMKLPPGASAIWNWLNRRIWNSATTISVPGSYMRKRLIEIYKVPSSKVRIMPIWGTPESSTAESTVPEVSRTDLGLSEDSFLIVHAGNIGLMHRLNDLIDAVGSTSSLKIELAITGGGVARSAAEEHTKSKNFKNIKFFGYLNDENFNGLLNASDIAATTLIPGMETVSMPSRALTYLSAGLPVFALMNKASDIGELVSEKMCGWVAETADGAKEIITELAENPAQVSESQKKAKSVYSTNYSRAAGVARYSKLINS